MKAYYNENDPNAAEWLRNLIKDGAIAAGDVDERSIADVRSQDLEGYKQVHLFAGIGGWPEALRLAEWPADRPVWTGSCPCPPFSSAGNKKCPACDAKGLSFFIGNDSFIEEFGCARCGWRDDRNLWPQFYRLIRECGPRTIYGEQVSSKTGLVWLAGIQADLERIGYRTASADLPSAGLASPNIRQRLWWVADSGTIERRTGIEAVQESSAEGDAGGPGPVERMADPNGPKLLGKPRAGEQSIHEQDDGAGGLGDSPGHDKRRNSMPGENGEGEPAGGSGSACGLGDTDHKGSQGRNLLPECFRECPAGATGMGFWSDYDLIPCTDDTQRRIGRGLCAMASGLPRSVGFGKSALRRLPLLAKASKALAGAKRNRIVRLRGYGNAINPFIAAEFVRAYFEEREEE